MNGDPSKDIIAIGQTYFAVKTRQQELIEDYDQLSEDQKRLAIRREMAEHMLPSMFGESLFDDFFDDDFMRFPVWGGRNPLYGKHAKNLMKTDVRETENTYEVDIDLPGFKKDEIDVDLKDGYLTISASKGLDKDQKDKEGKYIRQERYAGAMSRSFYVGDIQPEQISAKYEDGILKISLPKQEKKELPKSTTIAIG